MEIPFRNVAIINPGPIDMVQRKRDPSGGVTIHACTRRANGEGLYRGRGQGRHDSKDRPCCIIHREKGETKRKLGRKEERWRRNTNREKERRVLWKKVDENRRCGPMGI